MVPVGASMTIPDPWTRNRPSSGRMRFGRPSIERNSGSRIRAISSAENWPLAAMLTTPGRTRSSMGASVGMALDGMAFGDSTVPFRAQAPTLASTADPIAVRRTRSTIRFPACRDMRCAPA